MSFLVSIVDRLGQLRRIRSELAFQHSFFPLGRETSAACAGKPIADHNERPENRARTIRRFLFEPVGTMSLDRNYTCFAWIYLKLRGCENFGTKDSGASGWNKVESSGQVVRASRLVMFGSFFSTYFVNLRTHITYATCSRAAGTSLKRERRLIVWSIDASETCPAPRRRGNREITGAHVLCLFLKKKKKKKQKKRKDESTDDVIVYLGGTLAALYRTKRIQATATNAWLLRVLFLHRFPVYRD